MGKLLSFASVRDTRDTRAAQRRRLARVLVQRASELLEELEEDDRRIGWLLSDCATLLEHQLNETPAAESPH